MFRRSRFSVRPNVGTVGRTAAAAPQEAPSASQEAGETPTDINESRSTAAVTENKSVVTASEKPTSSGDGNDQNGEGASASAAVQRRKRFSIKPKVAPGRLSTLSRTPKSPAKAVSETSISDLEKPTTSSQSGTPASPRGLQSPRRRRPSEDSRQLKVQPKPFIQSDTSGPSAVPPADDSQEQTVQSANPGKQLESPSDGPVKEVSFAVPDKVKPSLTDKEATEISEKAKTLVSSRCNLSLSNPAFSLSRLLNNPSDMQKIAKAQKLRELLRQEMHREKGKKKLKAIKKEFSLDPAKMTMRDLIRYLPEANPMTSSLEETVIENETVVVPPSPAREASQERAQDPEPVPEVTGPGEEDEEEDQEEDQDDSLMVPQVKVAEDGTLIIDEESLTVEVLRAKGPNPANDRDPIFERGSTTTYASFRKATYSKPWSSEETDMFFLAISMVGTDFSMICQLFPHRARSMIKNKFKKEEKENSWRVDKAFRERRKLDIEYFSKLLEKILEVQKTRKKLKSVAEKNPPKKEKKKRKSRKNSKKLIDVEEEDEDNESSLPDLEGEGEKENEDLCNEGETEVSKIQKKRKRKSDALIEEPKEKKNKAGKKGSEQDEACVPEDAEAAPPMDNTNPDMSEKSEDVNAAKDATIKPAKLSRGRAPKPLLPLGRKWGKKPPKSSTKAGDDAPDKEDESEMDGASKEQLNKDASPLKQANKKSDNDDNSSEEEETTVQPLRPTRYGRVPKPIKPLNYPAREDAHSSASESTSASSARPEPKPPAKRGRSSKAQSAQESKKSKLVTLRASQTDYSDEDNGEQWEEQQEEQQQQQPACGSIHDSIAPAFVPASLRSPQPMISEVEETMEELEILANMPDVLGISQDALCPDDSCELAQNETGTSEPCEHQLDLLVDVIDFLSSEHPEVTEDESYNEAAQTLLTISSLAHISQPEQNQLVTQEPTTETISANLSESTTHLEEEIALMQYAQEEKNAAFISAASIHGVIETSETVTTLELQGSTTDSVGMQSCNQQTGVDVDPLTKLHASPEGSKKVCTPTKRGRLSKVKPKPNLGRALRAAPSKSQPDTSTAEESGTDAPNLVKATGTISAAEEIPEVIARHEDMSKDDDVHRSCSDVKLTEEQSGTQERSDAMTSGPETQRLNDTGDSWSNESHVWSAPRSTSNLATSDAAVEDLQIGPATNLGSALVQESSEPLASGVTPVEDFLDNQKQDSRHASSPKTRISRFQKVKPKPNLALRSEPQTIENDPNPTPNLEILSAEPTSLEKPGQSAGSASDSTALLEFGPALTLSAGIANMDEKTVVGNQDSSENQNFSVALSNQSKEQAAIETKPTPESTDDVPSCTGGSNQPKSDTKVTESQVEQGSIIDSAPVVPAEVLPVSQKQENEGSSTCKTRISRFQKIKSKPNVAQASRALRSKPQTANKTIENDPNPTPNLEILSAEPTSLEKPGQRAGSASDSTALLEFGPALTLSEEIPNMDEKKTVVGFVSGDDNSGVATLDQDSSENQIFSVALSNQSTEQAAIETKPTPESTDDVPSYTGGSNQPKSDTIVTESQVEQGSIIDSAPVVPAEVLPVSQKQENEGSSTCKTRISRFQKVKPKPNVAQASRALRSKPQTANETIENDPNPTPNLEILSAEPTSLEKPGQRAGSASDSTTLLEFGPALTLSAGIPNMDEKKTVVGFVSGDDNSGVATLDQDSSENQNFSVALSNQSKEQAAIETKPTPESTDDVPSCTGGSNQPKSDTVVTESQVEQGSIIDSAPVVPAEVLPVSQKQENEGSSTSKTRISRFQKVKPKPNVAQASRALRSKPQTANETIENDPNPTPNLEILSAEPTSLEKTDQRAGSASDSTTLLEFGPALTLSAGIPNMDEKKTVVGFVSGDDNSGVATLDQDSSENQNFSVALSNQSKEQAAIETKPTPESTDDVPSCTGGSNQPKSDTIVTESQVEQGSIIDSAPVVPAEVLPVSQKQENEGSSTCKTRISRFQKVKPKPNVAQASRTVRSKSQTTKETVEEKSQPTPNLNVHEKTTDVCAEPSCITLTEDPREDIGLALDLIPSSVPESTVPTEERAKTEREEEEVGVAGGSVTFDQRPSENQIFSEAQFDTTSASQPTVQDLTSHVGTTESRSSFSQTSYTTVTESPVEQGSNVDSASLQKQSELPISHVERELPVSQKQESEEASSAQARRSRFQRVKLKPNVALTSRTARPKPQTTCHVEEKDSIEIPKPTLQEQTKVEFFGPPACTTSPEKTSQSTDPAPDDMPSLDLASAPSPKGNFPVNEEQKKDTQDFGGGTVPSEKPGQIDSIGSVSKSKLELGSTQKASEDLSSAEEPVTDVGRDSSSEGSQLNVAQRRRRVPRVKPNIGSSTRARQTKIQSDDVSKPLGQCHKDSPENTGQRSLRPELLSSTKSGPEESVDILKDKAVSLTADGQSDSVLDNKTTKNSNVEGDKMPTSEKVDAGAAPHWDHKEDTFIGAIEIPAAVSDVQSTEGGSKESHIRSNLPANKPSTSDSESQHQDVQQRSGTNQTAAQSTPEDHLKQTDSPKPDLGPPQPQRVQDADQAAADSAPNSDGVDVSVSHEALPELQPDIQEQVEEALSQLSSQNLPPSVAGSSFGCEVEAPYRSTQDAPLQSTEESLSDPSFSIFPDMLSEQMPSDSEEKFIILSLIEIPVCQQEDPSLLLPCPAVTEASMQQQSVPAECVTAAGVESVSSAALDVSAEESQQTGLIKDPGSDSAARTGSITDKQVEQQGSAAVQPATLPGSVEGAEETERPPTKQKLQGATRRAKRQVNTSRKKQADPTVPAEEEESPPLQTNATEESELPGLSVQPRESDTPQKKGASKKAPTASQDPEESRSAAHTRPTRASRNRNLRGSLPETNNMAAPSCSTPARATSIAQKVKTPRAAKKQSAAEPEASTSREVAPTLSSAETSDEPQPTPVTSAPTADGTFDLGDAALGSSQSLLEVFPSQQSLDLDGSSIEDATSVSQYFLSDIFTDVDEG